MTPSPEQQQTRLVIPEELKPGDGRFGCGPSKVRPRGARAPRRRGRRGDGHLASAEARARRSSARSAAGCASCSALPDGYEVALGNGGATAFWDAAAFGLVRERALHLTYGEFSQKFATVPTGAPFLARAGRSIAAEPGDAPDPAGRPGGAEAGADVVAWAHNETSTGVMVPVCARPAPATRWSLIDATSGAGGLPVDVAQADAYYFAPQKGFAADGGLWIALLSPAAQERIARARTAPSRWIPPFLSLQTALENSLKDQTYNTPAVATLFLLADQVALDARAAAGWTGASRAPRASSEHLYGWAERSATRRRSSPTRPSARWWWARSTSTTSVDAAAVAATLRANGIVDIEPYRKLGRNQLRIGMFPAVEPADVQALTACIDWVVERRR